MASLCTPSFGTSGGLFQSRFQRFESQPSRSNPWLLMASRAGNDVLERELELVELELWRRWRDGEHRVRGNGGVDGASSSFRLDGF